ncbi:MAG: Myo-inositol 2-dehydrogenase, partial [uncultured Phycisphaerae bacterium]
ARRQPPQSVTVAAVRDAPHVGHAARPEVPVGSDHLRRQGDAQGVGPRVRLHPAGQGRGGPQRRRDGAGAVSRGQDREGLGEARGPGHPRAHEGLPRVHRHPGQ